MVPHTPFTLNRVGLVTLVLFALSFPAMAGMGVGQGELTLSGDNTVIGVPQVHFTLPSGSAGWSSFSRNTALPSTTGDPDQFSTIDEKLTPGEADVLKSVIQDTLHAFSYDQTTRTWSARNYATQVTFTYSKDGTAQFSDGRNTFGMIFLGIGREGDLSQAGEGTASAEGRLLEINRAGSTEWYRNDNSGIEQGMTILERPAGDGDLRVGFGMTGDVSFHVRNGQELTVTDATGTDLFTYAGLTAISADGRILPASLATDGTTLFWVVDDAGAAYPVTIDPVVVPASLSAATFTGGAGSDTFGSSVALSADGSVALVGAIAANTTGAAYLFTMPPEGWSGTTPVSAANATFLGEAVWDYFGYSVALSADGRKALVGAKQYDASGIQDTGAAYIFEAPGGVWSGTIPASSANATFTGSSVNDWFGTSVAFSGDGSVALVGAETNDTASDNDFNGAAYIFERPAGGWSGTTPSYAANATFIGEGSTWNQLGCSVALSTNGNTAMVGAYQNDTPGKTDTGAAYIFQKPAGGWNKNTRASSANATFTGVGNWDRFGVSVSLNWDGSQALVGALIDNFGSGAAYIFEKPSDGWNGTITTSSADATFTGGSEGEWFGNSVSLSSDGSRALVGADYNDTAASNAGAAYIFEKPAAGWGGTTPSSAADAAFTGGAADDGFGYAVSLSSDGSRALVGANHNDTAGTDAGAAYLVQPPFATLTAGGTVSGQTGKVVGGLTLKPTSAITNADLYLGTSPTILYAPVKTGINLPASGSPSISNINLAGKNPGKYYLIVTGHGNGLILGATKTAAYTVTSGPAPTISTLTPTSGLQNTTITFSLSGTNLPSGSVVNFTNRTYGNVTTTLNPIIPTKITGSVLFPPAAPTGKWDVVVTFSDGTNATKAGAFTLKSWSRPTVGSFTPTSGYRNTTVPFSLSGTNFEAGAMVNFTNSTYSGGNLTAVLSSVTPTKVTGNLTIPANVPTGKWDIVVTTPDGGQGPVKKGSFTVNSWKPPTVSSVAPTSGYRNATLSFSLSGSNFQAGALVNFTNATYGNVTATLGSVTLTKITGTVIFPPGAPTGKWDLSVITPDGGQSLPKTGAFTVNAWKSPTVSSISPTSGLLNTTADFTLSGTGFQQGAVVNFTNSTYPGGNLTTVTTVVSSTKITGKFTIPYNAPVGKWNIVVTTPDGGQGAPKTGAFTVKDWSRPTISSINQTKGMHSTTLNYAVTGTNFQPGSTVTFSNSTAAGLNFTAVVSTVTISKITGSVFIPADRIGKYGIEVLCPDGKVASKANAFTIT